MYPLSDAPLRALSYPFPFPALALLSFFLTSRIRERLRTRVIASEPPLEGAQRDSRNPLLKGNYAVTPENRYARTVRTSIKKHPQVPRKNPPRWPQILHKSVKKFTSSRSLSYYIFVRSFISTHVSV